MVYRYDGIRKPNLLVLATMISTSSMVNKSVLGITWDEGNDKTLSVEYADELSVSDKEILDVLVDNIRDTTAISSYVEKSSPAADDVIVVEDSADGNIRKKVKLGKLSSTPGSMRTGYAESLGESSTNLSTYQEKLSYSFTPPETGDYEILFSFMMKVSAANKKVGYRIQIDDVTTRGGGEMYSPSSIYQVVSGAFRINFADVNAHTIDLDYRRVDSSTVYIKEATFIVRKM